jgi:aspartyl-tRNA synthetase
VANRRDHGGIIFIDLRDRYGFTQTVYDPADSEAAWKVADTFRGEYVVKLHGTVRARPAGQENSNLSTGEIEVIILESEILAESKTPPFVIDEHSEANEEVRFKHRYLDLRRRKTLSNVEFRAKMNHFARNWFTGDGFLEVQTPIFTVSSPEGARDYLIPSRLHHGKFYALPQAPQQYKQLLMVGGIDRYFQIAPCFRDEDPRADRHSCEFYQIDCEMSFVEERDVQAVAERFAKDLVAHTSPQKRVVLDAEGKFFRITHTDALDTYGSDKPDFRFGMQFETLTEDFRNSGFSVFASAVADGGVVKAMKFRNPAVDATGAAPMSRSEIDAITAVAQAEGAKGLAYIIYEETGPRSPILKFFTGGELEALEKKFSPKAGDMIFFGAGDRKLVNKVLGKVRLALRDQYSLANEDELAFAWVTDFPMYERKDDGSVDFEHNPFSMPHGGVTAFDGDKDPVEIHGMQFDLACNGYEVLSGSIRNHDIKALVKGFEIVGKGEAEIKAKFGAMYEAFQFGVPPHGGFAFGFDRLMMILCDEPNIREVYAFPKSGKAEDTMMNAPSEVDEIQLRELHVKIREHHAK